MGPEPFLQLPPQGSRAQQIPALQVGEPSSGWGGGLLIKLEGTLDSGLSEPVVLEVHVP
jgi:hypothetical protein